MKQNIIAVLLSFFLFLLCICASQAEIPEPISFCSTAYCGMSHLACNNIGNFTEECVPETRTVSITKYRASILNAINSFRNRVAGGIKGQVFPAAKMGTMKWSNELEYFAYLIVTSCITDQKYCLSSPDFYYIGSLTAKQIYEGKITAYSSHDLIMEIFENWMAGLPNVITKTVLLAPENLSSETQATALLLIDRNTDIGCSAVRYNINYYNHFLFACTFATDLMFERQIYKLSGRSASACKKRNNKYPFLCSIEEEYHNEIPIANAEVYDPPVKK